jgi:hypothetical protein
MAARLGRSFRCAFRTTHDGRVGAQCVSTSYQYAIRTVETARVSIEEESGDVQKVGELALKRGRLDVLQYLHSKHGYDLPNKVVPCHGRFVWRPNGANRRFCNGPLPILMIGRPLPVVLLTTTPFAESRLKCWTLCFKMAVLFGAATMVPPLLKKVTLRSCDGQRQMGASGWRLAASQLPLDMDTGLRPTDKNNRGCSRNIAYVFRGFRHNDVCEINTRVVPGIEPKKLDICCTLHDATEFWDVSNGG